MSSYILFRDPMRKVERLRSRIFDSRRPVALSDSEKPPRDFYLSGGSELGLKPGVLVTVTRHLALYNSLENRSAGDLTVQVGKVKIIHVQSGLSVARFHSLSNGPLSPALEEDYIMVGDALDLSTVEIEPSTQKSTSADLSSSAPSVAIPQNQ